MPKVLGPNLPDNVKKSITRFEQHRNYAVDVHFGLKSRFANPGLVFYLMVLSPEGENKSWFMFPSNWDVEVYAPPGKQQIYAELFMGSEEYKRHGKEKWINYFADLCEMVFPGFKREIEVADFRAVTPATSAVYSSALKVPMECPDISHLYFVGDYTIARAMGMERSADSAMFVAKRILRKEGKFAPFLA